jgi:hypothetical protein
MVTSFGLPVIGSWHQTNEESSKIDATLVTSYQLPGYR